MHPLRPARYIAEGNSLGGRNPCLHAGGRLLQLSHSEACAGTGYHKGHNWFESFSTECDMSSSSSSFASPQENAQMVDDSQFLHGRIDPGLESSVDLVEAVDIDGLRRDKSEDQRCIWNDIKDESSQHSPSMYNLSWHNGILSTQLLDFSLSEANLAVSVLPIGDPTINTSGKDHLTLLPSELIDHILTFLEPFDLVAVQKSAKYLCSHANEDIAWQRFVQQNVPGVTLKTPSPHTTFRDLYIAHDPYWFLPKYKIWFSDYFLTGKIIIVRYDQRRGCIEGYRLVAERTPPTFDTWEADEEVLIHSFAPQTKLHLDQPVLHLSGQYVASQGGYRNRDNPNKFQAEVPMLDIQRNNVFSNFLLTRPVEERPNMQMWPPLTVPSRHRVRNVSQQGFLGDGHRPKKRADISDLSFRIRHWMEMTGGSNALGIHLGEEVYTYATLDPKLYTPTEDKPWRGIWVGDYSGHGCEFLLMNQPDDNDPFDESSVVQHEDETSKEFEIRKKEERINRGSLEAIKLTGDPNIPRGEYTFICDDLSQTGYIRTADEARFKGARIVRSRGHIAARMFRNGKVFCPW